GTPAPVRVGLLTGDRLMRTVRLFCTGGAAAVLLALLAHGADPKPGPDWPVFRGNALQTGLAATELPAPLKQRWKFQAKDSVEGAAAVVGDTVYFGSIDEHLYALDLATGKEKWKTKVGPVKAPPGVRGGAVYVGDADGKLHCVDAATGKPRWKFETGDQILSG